MNILTLDCEYNQPSHKVIQIGAAVYAARTGQLQGTFETYVNPGEPINRSTENGLTDITALTGITDRDVQNAPGVLEAFLMLQDFHKKHKVFMNPLVWGAGVRNDSQLIYDEANATLPVGEKIHNFMGYRVIDVKGLFQSIQIYHNKTVRGGLAAACQKIGIGFEGEPHRALTDAMNTYRVWHYLIKQHPEGYK
jgi:inhibitor of KinA sporulation pathway (predicted exonuclease)